jgi:hypothetical protein
MKDKRRSFAHGRVIALAAALSCGAIATAQAEVHIEGSPDAVRITANHDTIAGVLAAVATTFHVKYRTTVNLTAPTDGTYSGSLRQVISRLLGGYNYVVKSDQDTIEIVVFDARGAAPMTPASPLPTPTNGLVARWR